MSATPPHLSPAGLQALETSAFHLIVSKYYSFSAIVMLMYDTVLTFDREVEVLWHSKWSSVKCLFFFNRYANIGAYLVIFVALHSVWPKNVCNHYAYFPGIFNMLQQVVIGVILILFMFALFNRSKPILAMVSTTFVAQLVVIGWSLGALTAIPLPPGFVGCIYAGRKGTGIRIVTAWIMQLVFISVVFGLMIWKAVMLHRLKFKAPLITIMTRDGLKYFGVIFGANFVNVLNFSLVEDVGLKPIHATFSALITVIMINRLILSVREEAARQTIRSLGTDMSHISFADTTMDVPQPRQLAVTRATSNTAPPTFISIAEVYELPQLAAKS